MNCPFCKSEKNKESFLPKTIFNSKIFTYIECKECSLIYLNKFPTDDDFIKIYPTSYQAGVDKTILNDLKSKLPGLRFSYKSHFDLIKKYCANATILDYGCGNANFLINAKHNSLKCDGTEFSIEHVNILKNEINDSQFYTIDEFLNNETKKYNVIRLSNVLEHLINPKEIIEKIKLKLEPNGILLIEGPIETNLNLAYIFRKLFFLAKKATTKNWTAIHPPSHIFFSNYKNQLDFFSNLNLDTLHYEVSESEWPFPNKKAVKNAPDFLKFCIAKISITISKFIPKWGNTFIYVGKIKTN